MNDQDRAARIEPLPMTPAESTGNGNGGSSNGQRLEVVSRSPARGTRPVTNLARVFGQFVEVQHQVTEQVLALEESISQEREVLAATVALLPDVKERINWLISSFYELGQKDVSIEQRVAQQDSQIAAVAAKDEALERRMDRQDAQIAAVSAHIQYLVDGQRRWESTMDQLLEVLLRARNSSPAAARSTDGREPGEDAAIA